VIKPNAETIAFALGGRRVGKQWMARCPCPAHEDTDPSLSIRDADDGKVLVRCHAGCDQSNVIGELRSRGLWNSAGDHCQRPAKKQPPTASGAPPAQDDNNQTGGALRLWRSASPAIDTAVASYLQSRGITVEIPDEIRFHPHLKHPSGGTWPGMLALVTRGSDGEPLAIHRTFLVRDGSGKAPVTPQKMMLGPCRGGAVRLAVSTGKLMVGEGIETCLSAMQATNLPAWAALSTAGLCALQLPAEIEEVIILADGDEPGEAAALDAARRWKREGRTVRIARPPSGVDFNDILLGLLGDIQDRSGSSKDLIRNAIDNEKIEIVRETPVFTPEPGSVTADNWRQHLRYTQKGDLTARAKHHNTDLLLTYHDEMRGVLGYNEFRNKIEVLRKPPWFDKQKHYPRLLADTDTTGARVWLELQGVSSPTNVHEAVVKAAEHNSHDPLKDHLNGLTWDGKERITTALCNYLGCEDSEYSRAVSRRFFIGAVARALEPGCKMDTMLVLEGDQGIGKSTAVSELFYNHWFSDDLSDIGSKDANLQLQGFWCIEIAELAAMRNTEVSRLKDWLSRRVDHFRPPYARNTIDAPRRCILVGTVNPVGGYLKDPTGARRFWPVRCTRINIEGIKQDRDQLWAETVVAYEAKERWWFETEENKFAREKQEERYQGDPWEDTLSYWLEKRMQVTIPQAMEHLKLTEAQRSQREQNRIARIFQRNGWVRIRIRMDGKLKYMYEKLPPNQ